LFKKTLSEIRRWPSTGRNNPARFAVSSRKSQSQEKKMKKLLTTLAALTVIATPAFAQSFDPDNGTGNVLSFSYTSTAPENDKIAVRQSGLHSYAMVPRTHSARVTRR
jgi:hypothetical protein